MCALLASSAPGVISAHVWRLKTPHHAMSTRDSARVNPDGAATSATLRHVRSAAAKTANVLSQIDPCFGGAMHHPSHHHLLSAPR